MAKCFLWGLPTRLKLRSEAAVWFQELRNAQPTDTYAGEPAYWVDHEDLPFPYFLLLLTQRDAAKRGAHFPEEQTCTPRRERFE